MTKPPKRKRPIKSTVTVHDRTQIETVFDYYLNRGVADGSAQIRYRVEAFLFYPRQFGLDPQSYPKDKFYGDIRPLIRFREPKLGFKQMLGMKGTAPSPLVYLRKYVESLAEGRLDAPFAAAIDEVRIFACSFISNFLRGIDRKRRRYNTLSENPDVATPEDVMRLMAGSVRHLEKAHLILLEYRQVLTLAMALPDEIGEGLKTELRLIDEYCYYRLRDGTAYLLLMAEDLAKLDPAADVARYIGDMRGLVARHDAYAQRAGYLVLRSDSPLSVRERFMHRRGELKRRVWSALFLDLRTEPLLAFQRQTGAMLAAGLAAIWAFVAQILVMQRVISGTAANGSMPSSSLLNVSGVLIASFAVLAYVVKDRIKEFGRTYFRGRLFGELPDHSERIYFQEPGGERNVIGMLRETAKYERADEIPADLQELRRAIAASGDAVEESPGGALHYTKTITLQRKIKLLSRYNLRAVHDILRINIDTALSRLAEPSRSMHVVDADGEVREATFPKVYFFDLALRYSRVGKRHEIHDDTTSYFRLVVDKGGLKRIERVR